MARNLDDEMIKLLAQRGGVMGLNYCSAFIEENDEGYTPIEGMVKHIRHIADVGGIDCIGLGSDFDGIESRLEIKDASGLPKLYEALKKYFSEEEIEKEIQMAGARVQVLCLVPEHITGKRIHEA